MHSPPTASAARGMFYRRSYLWHNFREKGNLKKEWDELFCQVDQLGGGWGGFRRKTVLQKTNKDCILYIWADDSFISHFFYLISFPKAFCKMYIVTHNWKNCSSKRLSLKSKVSQLVGRLSWISVCVTPNSTPFPYPTHLSVARTYFLFVIYSSRDF